jgi:hypothetical protein
MEDGDSTVSFLLRQAIPLLSERKIFGRVAERTSPKS